VLNYTKEWRTKSNQKAQTKRRIDYVSKKHKHVIVTRIHGQRAKKGTFSCCYWELWSASLTFKSNQHAKQRSTQRSFRSKSYCPYTLHTDAQHTILTARHGPWLVHNYVKALRTNQAFMIWKIYETGEFQGRIERVTAWQLMRVDSWQEKWRDKCDRK